MGNPIMDISGNANQCARSKPPERQEKGSNDVSISNSEISDSQSKSGFMYLPVIFSTTQISALLDSGSTINLETDTFVYLLC